jgi:hypothetical protein
MASILCAYGNCSQTDTPYLLTIKKSDPGERVRFCSLDHLILWAKKRELMHERNTAKSDDGWRLGVGYIGADKRRKD